VLKALVVFDAMRYKYEVSVFTENKYFCHLLSLSIATLTLKQIFGFVFNNKNVRET
jgi:hypothetical protein